MATAVPAGTRPVAELSPVLLGTGAPELDVAGAELEVLGEIGVEIETGTLPLDVVEALEVVLAGLALLVEEDEEVDEELVLGGPALKLLVTTAFSGMVKSGV